MIRRLPPLVTGALLGVALGIGLATGHGGIAVMVAFDALLVAAALRSPLARPGERRDLATIVAPAFALRLAVAVALFTGSVAAGRGGFIVGDDQAYADLAWAFVRYLAGYGMEPDIPPLWHGQAYLFGTYVYLESVVFWIFGHDHLVLAVLNSGLSTVTLIVLHWFARELFGRRAALLATAVVAFYPSLVLWASLNLKDALVLLITTTALAIVLAYIRRPRVATLIAVYALMLPLESMRRYAFVGLTVIVPLTVLVAARFGSLWPRARATVVAAVASAMLVSMSGLVPFLTDPVYSLVNFDIVRRSLAAGARTGIGEPVPIKVHEGETFVVPGDSDGTGTIRRVGSGQRVVIGDPSASAEPGTIIVRPGDIVVIGEGDPQPEAQRRLLNLNDQRGAPGVQLAPALAPPESEAMVLDRTLAHLPRGLAYALFAPFPWQVQRPVDAAPIPEMLLWYAVMAGALWTVWRERRRWRELLPTVLYLGGVFAIFALVEGNVGTLYRHRGMLIPYAVVLAAPSALLLLDRRRRGAR